MNPIKTDSRVASSDDTDDDDHVDGRTARRDRNRVSVLDAVIDLFGEGNFSPGVHEVARQSGVSLRSVYRYFDDVDSLIAAAIERQFDEARPHFAATRGANTSLDERIVRFCRSRVDLFEEVRVVYAAATVRSRTTPAVAERLAWMRLRLSDQLEQLFRPELATRAEEDARITMLTLDILAQFDSLELLRETRSLSVDDTVAYLVDAFQDILG